MRRSTSASEPSSATVVSRRWCSPAVSPTGSSSGCSRCRSCSVVCSGLVGPDDVESTLKDHGFGAWAAAAVAQLAGSSDGNEWWLLLVGAYLVLWTGYTCSKALVLAHAAVWQMHPPKVARPVRASLVFNGFTLGFIAAMAGARWLREDHSRRGLYRHVHRASRAVWILAGGVPGPPEPRQVAGSTSRLGAALVGVGLQAMHLFTTYFLGPKLTSATQLYGIIGVATTMLFWFYLGGRLIIAAATLSTSFSERHDASHEMPLRVVNGGSVDEAEVGRQRPES